MDSYTTVNRLIHERQTAAAESTGRRVEGLAAYTTTVTDPVTGEPVEIGIGDLVEDEDGLTGIKLVARHRAPRLVGLARSKRGWSWVETSQDFNPSIPGGAWTAAQSRLERLQRGRRR